MNNRINVRRIKNVNNIMLRAPKYKYYNAAFNSLVIVLSFTFIVNLFFALKQYQESFSLFIILSLILTTSVLIYVLFNKSNKFYEPNIIRTKSSIHHSFTKDNIVKTFAEKNGKNLLIVGNGNAGKKLALKVLTENKLDIKIKGLINDESIKQNVLDEIIKEEIIDEILISVENKSYAELMYILDLCCKYGINIKLSSDLFKIIPQKIQAEKYYDIPVIDITPPLNSALYLKIKRIVDFLLSVTGIIFLTPVFLIIMISIKVTSKGPIFYKQKRVGLNGRLFDFYKFRSMYFENGEDKKRENMMIDFMKNNQSHKIIDSARVTRVGRFIRKTSLDELPQLFNVIKGNMSIVGPRPCLPYEFANYADWQKRRVKVLPGCTGVWQVSGRSSVSFFDSIILDLFYIKNMSPLYDIILILKTIPVIFFAKGGE
jgi:exopolysaccharide biosynthesis polyprenyl glycosylphosphotransferase